MVELPADLVDLFVEEISEGDIESLKSCCLTARVFRLPCQKRLLNSVHLCDSFRDPNHYWGLRTYSEVSARFGTTPYLASYVTRIRVWLPEPNNEAIRTGWEREKDIAESVLRCLRNLRKATIYLDFRDFSDEFSIEVLDWMVALLHTHGTMTCFSLRGVNGLTRATLHRILAVAPSLKFFNVRMAFDPGEAPSGNVPSERLTRLKTERSRPVYKLLLRPEYQEHISSLREVNIDDIQACDQEDLVPCFRSAGTLERIELHRGVSNTVYLPSCLPRLHDMFLALEKWASPPLLLKVLSPATTPALVHLTLYANELVTSKRSKYKFTRKKYAKLDQACAAHPTIKTVKWFIHVVIWNDNFSNLPVHLAGFWAALRQAMPKSEAKGILVLDGDGENY
ncbi:hypothetical protein C8F01DRAFT_626502 [Mycena amicta]|nr:hypothetical protein C8F01DRAFT_626502 [Mycena amicta]